ncbi:CorA metal ion transporter, partial [Tulasnella sp. 408]
MLSLAEQDELLIAQGETPRASHAYIGDGEETDMGGDEPSTRPPPPQHALSLDHEAERLGVDIGLVDSMTAPMNMDAGDPTGMGMGIGGLPTYQPTAYRSHFDFSFMEQFAGEEKNRLGLNSPALTGAQGPLGSSSTGAELRRRLAQAANANLGGAGPSGPAPEYTETAQNGHPGAMASSEGGEVDAGGPSPSSFVKKRQRKLSQSNSTPRRQGKLAMFEGHSGPPPPALMPSTSHHISFNVDPLAAGSSTNLPNGLSSTLPITPPHLPSALSTQGPGHDRPYRFSFYSNALPHTIHARSLSELPAEGQSFEELFIGKGGDSAEATRPNSRLSRTAAGTGTATPADESAGLKALPKDLGLGGNGKAAMNRLFGSSGNGNAGGGGGGGRGGPARVDVDPNEMTWWLDVTCPTEEEMRMLSKVFAIHPLTTEDILMEEAREKIELFRNYYFFHFRGTPHPQAVRRRIKQLKDYINVTSDWISYALIDDITDAFGPLIQSIEYEVDSIDELVLILKETEQSDMLRRIGTCRKKVMGLLRLMGNKADVVKGLAKRCNENWSVAPKSDIGLYLSDIQDHLITMTQNLNHYEKILSRSHSNYLAQISIEMTDANNQINDVLSKLTALGTVLVPMNLVTGLWGMNVHVPGQDIETGYTWFLS